jgi:phosphoglycerate dehydrogenase-like enzyme
MYAAFAEAVRANGAALSSVRDASGLVWADPHRASMFPEIVRDAPNLRWIQLPYAGIEPFASYLDPRYVWTCGKGVYAAPVAEHALALMLAGLRGLGTYVPADHWLPPIGTNLIGARVLILGGGGICDALIGLLAPFRCEVTVFRRQPQSLSGTRVITGRDDLWDALPTADVVVIALALTAETESLVDAAFLGRMAHHAWLINVGRGRHVVTDALVAALAGSRIGGAALDVTEPEPLPDNHPLWTLGNCIITPHIANTPEMGLPLITARVAENVRRFVDGAPLVGLVDVSLGY